MKSAPLPYCLKKVINRNVKVTDDDERCHPSSTIVWLVSICMILQKMVGRGTPLIFHGLTPFIIDDVRWYEPNPYSITIQDKHLFILSQKVN